MTVNHPVMSTDVPPLGESRAALRKRMTGWPAADAHMVADSVLYGYAIDVHEQAQAVEILSASEDFRASFTNARSAMEAAQDMLLLTSDESNYDRFGCLARCHELLEYDDLKERMRKADTLEGIEPAEWTSATSVVESDAARWDDIVPGGGDILRGALAELESKRPRHWSAKGRKQISESVATSVGASPGWAAMHDALYGLASIHSHPRPRSGLRALELKGNSVTFGPKEDHDFVPQLVASMACIFATDALERRLGFFSNERPPNTGLELTLR